MIGAPDAGFRRFPEQSHLVSVEVRVECCTSQRVEFDCSAFHQDRLESLNAEAVKRRSTVEHYRMILDHGLKGVPDFRSGPVDHLSGALDVIGNSLVHKILHNKGFEELKCHFLRKTALIKFQFRSDNDNGTSGVVNTFSEEVLTESSLLTFQHIGKALKRSASGTAGDRSASASVVDQCVYSFLEHALLVADDDVRCAELEKSLKTVVAVDDPAVQIVQVTGGKTSAVQLNHRTKIRRNDRNNGEDHPFRPLTGSAESLHDLQTLSKPCAFLTGSALRLLFKGCFQFFQIDLFQKILDCFRTHFRCEFIFIAFAHIAIFLLGEKAVLLKRGITGIGNDISRKVENALQIAGAQVEHKADP